MSEVRMSVACEPRRDGRWEARITLPAYDVERASKDISAGPWQSMDAHGLLVSVTDPKDLRALGLLLIAAGDKACLDADALPC